MRDAVPHRILRNAARFKCRVPGHKWIQKDNARASFDAETGVAVPDDLHGGPLYDFVRTRATRKPYARLGVK